MRIHSPFLAPPAVVCWLFASSSKGFCLEPPPHEYRELGMCRKQHFENIPLWA
jgi:hypothetical protein